MFRLCYLLPAAIACDETGEILLSQKQRLTINFLKAALFYHKNDIYLFLLICFRYSPKLYEL